MRHTTAADVQTLSLPRRKRDRVEELRGEALRWQPPGASALLSAPRSDSTQATRSATQRSTPAPWAPRAQWQPSSWSPCARPRAPPCTRWRPGSATAPQHCSARCAVRAQRVAWRVVSQVTWEQQQARPEQGRISASCAPDVGVAHQHQLALLVRRHLGGKAFAHRGGRSVSTCLLACRCAHPAARTPRRTRRAARAPGCNPR